MKKRNILLNTASYENSTGRQPSEKMNKPLIQRFVSMVATPATWGSAVIKVDKGETHAKKTRESHDARAGKNASGR